MAKTGFQIDPNWTKRSTFKTEPLKSKNNCKGCGRVLHKGEEVIQRTDLNPNNGNQKMVRAVCNEECFNTYDDNTWQAITNSKRGKYRPAKLN